MKRPKYSGSLFYLNGKQHALAGKKSDLEESFSQNWTRQQQAEYKYGRAAGIRQLKYSETGLTDKQKSQQLSFRQLGLLTRTQAGLIQIAKDFSFQLSAADAFPFDEVNQILQGQVDRIRANK